MASKAGCASRRRSGAGRRVAPERSSRSHRGRQRRPPRARPCRRPRTRTRCRSSSAAAPRSKSSAVTSTRSQRDPTAAGLRRQGCPPRARSRLRAPRRGPASAWSRRQARPFTRISSGSSTASSSGSDAPAGRRRPRPALRIAGERPSEKRNSNHPNELGLASSLTMSRPTFVRTHTSAQTGAPMERPHSIPATKALRWTTTPSEEQTARPAATGRPAARRPSASSPSSA